jgi:hypothetical protein
MFLADLPYKFAWRQCAFDPQTRHYIHLPSFIERSFTPTPRWTFDRGEIASASMPDIGVSTTDRKVIRLDRLSRRSQLRLFGR